MSIFGAVYGTLLVNSAKTMFSEHFPQLWLFAHGRVVHRRRRLPSRTGSPALVTDQIIPMARLLEARLKRRAAEPSAAPRTGRVGEGDHMASSTDFLLAVEAVTVSFDGFKAVDDLSSMSTMNEIRVIIGPNGAGKTTVLDLDLRPHQGDRRLDQVQGSGAHRLKEHEIVRAGVGRKFQTPSIYEDLTVFENLEISFPRGRDVFGALTSGSATPRCATRVDEIAEMIFLEDQLERPAEFSATARSNGSRSACC